MTLYRGWWFACFACVVVCTRLSAAVLDRTEIALALKQAQGTKVVSVFLTNDWDEDFTISKITTGCFCIGHDVSDRVLKPGDKSEIFLIFEIGMDTTSFAKKVVVSGQGKSGRNQDIPLHVKGKINPVFRISKTHLIWAKGGSPGEQTVTMEFLPEIANRIKSVTTMPESNLRISSLITPLGQSATVKVSLIDAHKPTAESFLVVTDHPHAQLGYISVLCTNGPTDTNQVGNSSP